MPDSCKELHTAVFWNQPDTVADILKIEETRSTLINAIKPYKSPLYATLNSDKYNNQRVQCQILLLALGADPYLEETPFVLYQNTAFFEALFYKDVLALRLMLLMRPPTPDYWQNKIIKPNELATAKRIMVRISPPLTFAQCLIDSVEAAWKLHTALEQAEALEGRNDLPAAAAAYETAVTLYEDYIKLEEQLEYPKTFLSAYQADYGLPKDCRPAVLAHYRQMQQKCYTKLFEYYKRMDEVLRNKRQELSPEAKKYHIELLSRWITIGGYLKAETREGLRYLRDLCLQQEEPIVEIAKVPKPPEKITDTLTPAALSTIPAETTSDDSDAETASLLSGRTERKSSGAFSILSWFGWNNDKTYEHTL